VNVSGIFIEAKNISTSGIATATNNTGVAPISLSATSPGANSLLVCGNREASTDPVSTGTSELYPYVIGPVVSGDHGARSFLAASVVGSGSQSCTITSGLTGVLAIFPNVPATTSTVRHRVVNF
jgi:hypothetical protein